MKVQIKQFDTTLPIPTYKSKGAVCVDLYVRIDVVIKPQEVGYVPLNVALEIPEGYFVLVAARTSTHKYGIMPAHGIGIGDWDFRGDDDEYVFPFFNFTKKSVLIERGIRIAQLMVLKYEPITFALVTKMHHPTRGKFGSTGQR